METAERTNSDDEAGEKLIPEWGVDADDQVLLAGLAVVLALLGLFVWRLWSDDDEDLATVASSVVSAPAAAIAGDGDATVGAAAVTPTTAADTATSEAAADATTTTAAATTTEAAAQAATTPDVQAAVDSSAGAITGTANGTVAVLEGFVANQGESDAAEAAAGAVEGIESVENNLVLLEPQVTEALSGAGVVGAAAAGVGTEVTLTGTLQSEDARQPAIDAASGVEGVTGVVDQLDVSVAADLNSLPQVQFATASAEILPESFEDLNRAAELITGAGDVQLLIIGHTDIQGDEARNQQLSEDRAAAVKQYLVDQGVADGQLTSEGRGETEQFGAGESAEALAANRVVLFEQTS